MTSTERARFVDDTIDAILVLHRLETSYWEAGRVAPRRLSRAIAHLRLSITLAIYHYDAPPRAQARERWGKSSIPDDSARDDIPERA